LIRWLCVLGSAWICDARAAQNFELRFGSSPVMSEIRFKRGDDPSWAAKDLDDSTWETITPRDLPARDGIYWVRRRITVWNDRLFRPRDGILLKVVASYDLYWDGRLIGQNGRVSADPDDEGPGNVDALFQIPAELLTPGEHVIALRMSSFHTGFRGPTYALNLEWGNFRGMLLARSRAAIFSLMGVGAALVVVLVFGLMWLLAGRRFPLLLFTVLFLCVALMQALQAWRWLFDYPYSWHYPRLVVITVLVTAIAALLPAFVMHHFRVGRPAWVYAALVVLIVFAWSRSPIYNFVGLYVCAVGFITAFALSIGAVARHKRGAAFACGGLALSVLALVLAPRDFLDHAFFISAGPAVVGLLLAVILQLRDERREAQQAVLMAARLETELLKKNIQPHFLLNTLATIQEVIEQEPRTAVALIDALANEFRILARVSGEKLISMEQELELCRAHLHVMSLRRGVHCSLELSGVEPDALVPPALFHTLIENGLTHLLPRDGRQDFQLRVEPRGDVRRYTLIARGERQHDGAVGRNGERSRVAASTSVAAATRRPDGMKEGTGIRYIKARLEESFTGQWSLSGRAVPEGWETIIELRGVTRTAHAEAHGGGRTVESAERPA
jgi:hypothetical protein